MAFAQLCRHEETHVLREPLLADAAGDLMP